MTMTEKIRVHIQIEAENRQKADAFFRDIRNAETVRDAVKAIEANHGDDAMVTLCNEYGSFFIGRARFVFGVLTLDGWESKLKNITRTNGGYTLTV